MKFKTKWACLMAVILLSATACSNTKVQSAGNGELVIVPQKPDYHNAEMWSVCEKDTAGTGADVFYIPSTWQFDSISSIGVCHWADPVGTPKHRRNMNKEITAVAQYMTEGTTTGGILIYNNVYSPYYRHISLDSWATLNEDTINSRFFPVAFDDVTRAFEHFIEMRPSNRPIVIAGFSQGGKCVVELLKRMTPDVRKRLVAAYVLGYKVTPDDAQSPNITAATGSNDTGVTICYNSVEDVKYVKPIVSAPCAFAINPVNWRTDETSATLQDTITVTLSKTHNVLVVKGYDSPYRPILDILNCGDIHSCEPWLYSECLRRNIADRIEAARR